MKKYVNRTAFALHQKPLLEFSRMPLSTLSATAVNRYFLRLESRVPYII